MRRGWGGCWGWVICALIKVSEIEPGDVCVEGGADIGHVLLCDHTCEVVYEWGEEERGDVRASVWGVEQEGSGECDKVPVSKIQGG